MNATNFSTKKTLSVIFIFALTLVYSSCKNKTVQQPSGLKTEIIDFSSFKIIETNSFPESIIKNVSYVKLDGSFDDILFREISTLKIANNRIYILDSYLRKLVVFDSSGKGLGKVGSQGQGPGEYLRIHDFCVNDAGDIYLKDGSGGLARACKLFAYDKDFNFISVKQLPFSANYIQHLTNDKFMFAMNSFNIGDNASSQIVITNNEFETEKTYLQFDENIDDNYGFDAGTFKSFGDRILYHRTIDNYVHEFSSEGEILKSYFFDFGKKDVPNNIRKNIEDNLEDFKLYHFIGNIVLINDKYIAGVLFDERIPKAFIVDRAEKCVYLMNRLDKGFHDMLLCYDNNLVSCLSPGKYEDIQSDDLPQDVMEHISNEDFVLCLYTLR